MLGKKKKKDVFLNGTKIFTFVGPLSIERNEFLREPLHLFP